VPSGQSTLYVPSVAVVVVFVARSDVLVTITSAARTAAPLSDKMRPRTISWRACAETELGRINMSEATAVAAK
jgi:hypothetical protein